MINVSIVTFNTPLDELQSTINTCANSTVVSKIFVVDNSSKDVLKSAIDSIKKVSYIHNPLNPGYGASHNVAIRSSLSDGINYHLVLNADVIFNSNILKSMLEYADSDLSIGILAPKMLYEDGSNQCSRKLLPTPINMFLRAFLPQKYRSKLDFVYQLEKYSYDSLLHVPYVSGAFMLLNLRIISKVGLFDERFFMYPEDIDLSRRVADVAKVLYCPNFIIIHKYGGATRKSLKMFIIHAYNMCLYFNKWGWLFDRKRNALNKQTLKQ
jgi:GT2 family glycosyltransferase